MSLLVVLIAGVALGAGLESCSADRRPCRYGTVRTLVGEGAGYDVVCAAPSALPEIASPCEREYKNAVDEVYRCREDLWKYENSFRMCEIGRSGDEAQSHPPMPKQKPAPQGSQP